MKKLILFLLATFHLFLIFSQKDTIYIEFNNLNNYDENCCIILSYNNDYLVNKPIEDVVNINGFSFVQPVKQAYNQTLKITTLKEELDTLPLFEYPCNNIIEIPYNKAYEIISNNKYPFLYPYKRLYQYDSILPLKKDTTIENILDGIVLGHYYIDSNFFEVFPEIKDSLINSYKKHSQIALQTKVTELMKPFYFSNYEISNGEYKAFINWVKDSIALHMIYDSIDEDQARFLLNLSKWKAKKLNPAQKQENLKNFGLNYQLNYETDPKYAPFTLSIYYPQPERFFKRKEIDTRKLIYENQRGDTIHVYPDSTLFDYSEMRNYYFWHPGYDNYPIHSISYKQAIAYCEWKEKQINQKLFNEGYQIKMQLPTLYHYEMALKYNQPVFGNHLPENYDNSTFTTYQRNNREAFSFIKRVHAFTQVLSKKELEALLTEPDADFTIKYFNWFKANSSYPIVFLNGNVSEYCSTPLTKEFIEYYKIDTTSIDKSLPLSEYRLVLGSNAKMDVIDLKGNQMNAIFYKQIIHKDQKTPFYGFRPIFYVIPN